MFKLILLLLVIPIYSFDKYDAADLFVNRYGAYQMMDHSNNKPLLITTNATYYKINTKQYTIPNYYYCIFEDHDKELMFFDGQSVTYNYTCNGVCNIHLSAECPNWSMSSAKGFIYFKAQIYVPYDNIIMTIIKATHPCESIEAENGPYDTLQLKKGSHEYTVQFDISLNVITSSQYDNYIKFKANSDNIIITLKEWSYGGMPSCW